MTFKAQAALAHDQDVLLRVAACATAVGIGRHDDDHPVAWANNNAWALAASPGWGEAYAVDGGDAITDDMISDAVQRVRSEKQPPTAPSPAE